MDDVIYALLVSRGVKSDEDAVAFLNPEAAAPVDPYRFDGMEAAVKRIRRAKDANEAVIVYGDYDVDGACATAIVVSTLRALGIDADHYIPSRAEGYGLNENAVRRIAQRASLMITVDLGITAVPEIALARALKLDVIVTDHHRLREELPDAILLHPALGRGVYPHYCGAGVAWLLASALDREAARSCLDLAALATVADVVPLTGANRAIVKLGLAAMNEGPRPGLRALIRAAGIEAGGLTAESLAFQLSPRLNAGGRLFSAEKSFKLLMSESEEEANALARELNGYNEERRAVENRILSSAREKLKSYDLARSGAIVLSGEDWHPGVVGLAASRLVESYGLPAIMLAREAGGAFVGSCRSIPGIDIMDALGSAAPLIDRYGGHPQAAGLTIREENIDAFREAVNAHILKTSDPDVFVRQIQYDLELPLRKLTAKLVAKLGALAPFGMANPEPVFLSDGRVVAARSVGKEGAHLQLRLADAQSPGVKAIWFRHGALANTLAEKRVTALYCARFNTYQGITDVDLLLAALKEMDPLSEERMGAELPAYAFAYLSKIAGGEAFQAGERLDGAREDEAMGRLKASPRGTLFYAHSYRAMRRFIGRLEAKGLSDRLDLLAFKWPQDALGMNALSFMPAGAPPPNYDRVYFIPGDAGEFSPSVDELRAVLIALRALFRKPYHFSTFRALTDDLAGGSGLSVEKCVAGLVILSEMELAEVKLSPLSCRILQPIKKNPEDSLAFRRLQALQ